MLRTLRGLSTQNKVAGGVSARFLSTKKETIRVGVLGGGISGLSFAHFVKKIALDHHAQLPDVEVHVFEKTDKFGGCMKTEKFNKGDLYFDLGPHSIRVTKRAGYETLKLVHDLNISNKMIFAPRRMDRIVVKDRKLLRLDSLLTVLKNFPSLASRLPLRTLLWMPSQSKDDMSIEELSSDLLGKEVTEGLVRAVMMGVYGGNIDKLSAKSCLKPLYDLSSFSGPLAFFRYLMNSTKSNKAIDERNKKMIQKVKFSGLEEEIQAKMIRDSCSILSKISRASSFSFEEGIGVLPNSLVRSLSMQPGVILRPNQSIQSIEFSDSPVLHFSDGSSQTFDHIVSALPPSQIAPLLPSTSSGEALKKELEKIYAISMAVVNVAAEAGFKKKLTGEKPSFGCLVPPRENEKFLGITFDDSVFADQSSVHDKLERFSVMIGGDPSSSSRFPNLDLYDPSDPVASAALTKELEAIAIDAVQRYLGVTSVSFTNTTIWKNAIPQFQVGHSKRIERINDIVDDLSEDESFNLIGNAFGGASINDCVKLSYETALRVLLSHAD